MGLWWIIHYLKNNALIAGDAIKLDSNNFILKWQRFLHHVNLAFDTVIETAFKKIQIQKSIKARGLVKQMGGDRTANIRIVVTFVYTKDKNTVSVLKLIGKTSFHFFFPLAKWEYGIWWPKFQWGLKFLLRTWLLELLHLLWSKVICFSAETVCY